MIWISHAGRITPIALVRPPFRWSPPLGALDDQTPDGSQDVIDVRQVWQLVGDEFSVLPAVDRGLIEQAWKSLVASAASDLQDVFTTDLSSSLLGAPMYREKTWRSWRIRSQVRNLASAPIGQAQGRQGPSWGQGAFDSSRFTAPLAHGPVRSDTRLSISVALTRAWVLEQDPEIARTLVMGYRGDAWYEGAYPVIPGMPAMLSRWAAVTRLPGAGGFRIRAGGAGPARDVDILTVPWSDLADVYTDLAPGEETDAVDASATWYVRDGHEFLHFEIQRRSTGEVLADVCTLMHVPPAVTVSGVLVGPWSDAVTGPGLSAAAVVADPEAPPLAADFRWLDPSLPPDLRFIPVLQSTPHAPSARFWYYDIDFNVVVRRGREKMAYLRTPLALPSRVWSESNAFINREAERQLVPLAGLLGVLDEQEEGEALRQKIFAALWALNRGPTISALAAAATALAGGAVAIEAGVVVDIRNREIEVLDPAGYRVYPYSEGLRVVVQVGDGVVPGQPLTEPAKVSDWVAADGNLTNFLDHEFQKYTAVTARVAYAPGTYESWPAARRAIEHVFRLALPVWVNIHRTLVRAVSTLSDDLGLSDRWRGRAHLRFFDNLGDRPSPRYSEEYGGEYGPNTQAGPPVYGDHFYISLVDEVKIRATNDSEPAGVFPLLTSEGPVSWEQMSGEGITRGRGVIDWPVVFTLSNDGDGELTFVVDAITYILPVGSEPVLVQTWSSIPSGTLAVQLVNGTTSTQTVTVMDASGTSSTSIPPSGTLSLSISYSNAPPVDP